MKIFLTLFFCLFCLHFLEAKRTIVISDLHLGSTWFQNGGQKSRLLEFLKQLAYCNPDVDTVILLGDVYELWNYKFNEKPPPLSDAAIDEDIRNGVVIEEFNDLFREIAQKKRLIIFPGNHDYDLNKKLVKKIFGNIKVEFRSKLVENGVRFEHGHFQDLFNTVPYSKKGQKPKRPFGYFCARAATTSNYGIAPKTSIVTQILSDYYDVPFSPELVGLAKYPKVMKEILQNVLCQAWKCQNFNKDLLHKVIVGGDENYKGKNVTVSHLLNAYKYYIKDFMKEYSEKEISWMVAASFNNYDEFLNRWKEDLVVLGHTHFPLLQVHNQKSFIQKFETKFEKVESKFFSFFSRFSKKKKQKRVQKQAPKRSIVYVNSGSWLNNQPNYVDITFKKKNGKWVPKEVQLKWYRGGCINKGNLMERHEFQ